MFQFPLAVKMVIYFTFDCLLLPRIRHGVDFALQMACRPGL